MTCSKRFRSVALVLSLSLATPSVLAQAEDQAAARTLFGEGRKLMKQGRLAEACGKLEAASKLYTSAGILLNLGDCYEKSGRTASAWTEFGDAAAVAKRTGRSTESTEASHRQDAVEPKLTRVTFDVEKPAKGMTLTVDGNAVPAAAWGTAIPVDPGEHALRAEAEGYVTWTSSVEASGAGRTVSVAVPELVANPSQPEAKAAEPASAGVAATTSGPLDSAPEKRSPSKVVDWTLIGGGAAIALGGGAVMLVESNRASTARSAHDKTSWDGAHTPYFVGVGGVAAGSVALLTGIVLLVTGKERRTEPASATHFAPWTTGTSGGLVAQGAF
ncbi:MAG TPA: PEGA domain-containing protein [Polyangiaceae bacterium]|jgi:hypothetical protein|nr:PEGA domain-containing protein [Polyangiaceae bacterium]